MQIVTHAALQQFGSEMGHVEWIPSLQKDGEARSCRSAPASTIFSPWAPIAAAGSGARLRRLDAPRSEVVRPAGVDASLSFAQLHRGPDATTVRASPPRAPSLSAAVPDRGQPLECGGRFAKGRRPIATRFRHNATARGCEWLIIQPECGPGGFIKYLQRWHAQRC
jgi:hypothetical protein